MIDIGRKSLNANNSYSKLFCRDQIKYAKLKIIKIRKSFYLSNNSSKFMKRNRSYKV